VFAVPNKICYSPDMDDPTPRGAKWVKVGGYQKEKRGDSESGLSAKHRGGNKEEGHGKRNLHAKEETKTTIVNSTVDFFQPSTPLDTAPRPDMRKRDDKEKQESSEYGD